MLNLNRPRLWLISAIRKVSAIDTTQLRIEDLFSHWHRLVPPRWQTQSRILRTLLSAIALVFFLCLWSYRAPLPLEQPQDILNYSSTLRLPHIPPRIWQIYLSFTPFAMTTYISHIHSWVAHSPSYSYTILDAPGAVAIVSKLSSSPTRSHLLPLFHAMSRRVMRADFLRYLLLAIEGGVYSDIDTVLLKPVHEWVPEEFRNRTRLIVGLEADQSPPVEGTTYEVQFCQWTLASAPGHPAMWEMVERILERVRNRPYKHPPEGTEYSDYEVLDITGPAGWTEIVFDHLSKAAGSPVTWHNLTGMREPKLYGDILVLPIDGFASGVPHSGASSGDEVVEGALVKHQFSGAWKNGID